MKPRSPSWSIQGFTFADVDTGLGSFQMSLEDVVVLVLIFPFIQLTEKTQSSDIFPRPSGSRVQPNRVEQLLTRLQHFGVRNSFLPLDVKDVANMYGLKVCSFSDVLSVQNRSFPRIKKCCDNHCPLELNQMVSTWLCRFIRNVTCIQYEYFEFWEV